MNVKKSEPVTKRRGERVSPLCKKTKNVLEYERTLRHVNVVNLSKTKLSPATCTLLGKGLSFIPFVYPERSVAELNTDLMH